MIHEINIYGDIVPFHCGWGDEYSLKDLNADLARLTVAENDELIVNIHTFGGCTATAFGILNKLQRFKKEKNIALTTRVDGWCASSGVIILLSSDTKRIGNSYAEPFIHNAWTLTMGDKNNHQKVAEDLARVDDQIATLYSQVANISKEDAISLMNSDGFITAQQSLDYGFFTELEDVEVVEIEVMNSIRNNNSKTRQKIKNNMSNQNQNDAWKNIKNMVDKFFGGAKNKVVFTADNSELDFYELDDTATPAVGDKAKYDGKPAGESNNGEYTMPSGDVYKFTGEELTEIVPKEEDATEDLAVENESLKTEIENLKNEVANLKNEKDTVNKKLNDATAIIKGFQNLTKENEDDTDDEDGKRNPKAPKNEAEGSRISNAVKNLKKINTNGSN